MSLLETTTGNWVLTLDDNDNESDRRMVIDHDIANDASKRLLSVDQAGYLDVYGRIVYNGTWNFAQTGLPTPGFGFLDNGVRRAAILTEGQGLFENGGINLRVVTSSPTSVAPFTSDPASHTMLIYNNSGVRKLAVFIPQYTDPTTFVTTPGYWLYSAAFT